MKAPRPFTTRQCFPVGCAALLGLFALTGCEKENRKGQSGGKPEPPERSVRRERTERPETTVAPKEGKLTGEEREEFETTLAGLEANRGQFLGTYFGDSPFGPLLGRLSLAELMGILEKHQYLPGSPDERVVLMHYFSARGREELEARCQFLLDRNDPELSNLCLRGLAKVNPEKGLEIINATIPRKNPLRSMALMNLFNVAAQEDFERAVKLANTLENPYERGVSITEILSNSDVTMLPLDTLAPIILNNPQTYGGKDTVFAVQAIRHHTVPSTLAKFDLNIPWQRKLIFQYLTDRGRSAKEDVKTYVDSSEGQVAFNEEERKTIMATFGANVYSYQGIGHDVK